MVPSGLTAINDHGQFLNQGISFFLQGCNSLFKQLILLYRTISFLFSVGVKTSQRELLKPGLSDELGPVVYSKCTPAFKAESFL